MLPKQFTRRLSLSVNGFNSNSIIKKDWGGEFSCPNITFEDDNFKAVEEKR